MRFIAARIYFSFKGLLLLVTIYPIFLWAQNIPDPEERDVLKISNVGITRYEFEKNLDLFKSDFVQKNSYSPSRSDIEGWIREFTNRTYFIADAYQKGYDTAWKIDKRVESMAHLIVSQQGGLLEQRILQEKLRINDSELTQALQQASKKIYVEYLKFKNYDAAINFLKSPEINHEQFREVMRKSAHVSDVVYKVDTLSWPFALFVNREDIISTFKKNTLTPVMSLQDGGYVMYIKDIEQMDLSDALKKQVADRLKLVKKDQMSAQYELEVKNGLGIKIDTALLVRMEKKLNTYGAIREFDRKKFEDILLLNIVSFTTGDQVQNKSVADFIDFYNYLPIRQEIRSGTDLRYYIGYMAYDSYAYEKAKELRITTENKFLLDKENYKKNVIYGFYEAELRKGITVSEDEIGNYYTEHQSSFVQPTDAIISIYSFKERNAAMMGSMNLQIGNKDPGSLQGVTKIERNIHLNYKSNQFSDSIKSVILNMHVSKVSRPFYFNDMFIVVIKESDSGSRMQAIEEVRDIIIKEIKEQKIKIKKQDLLEELKALYPLQDYIDHQK